MKRERRRLRRREVEEGQQQCLMEDACKGIKDGENISLCVTARTSSLIPSSIRAIVRSISSELIIGLIIKLTVLYMCPVWISLSVIWRVVGGCARFRGALHKQPSRWLVPQTSLRLTGGLWKSSDTSVCLMPLTVRLKLRGGPQAQLLLLPLHSNTSSCLKQSGG